MTFRGKTIYGSATHRVVIDFHDRPSPNVSGQVRFYERESLEEEKQFSNFRKLSDIVKRYWEKKTRTEVFDRRLASWFADYFHEMGLRGIDSYEVLEWLKAGTSELTAEAIDRGEQQRFEIEEAEKQKQEAFREQIQQAEEEKRKAESEESIKREESDLLSEEKATDIKKSTEEALPTLPPKKDESIMTGDDMVKAVLERVEPKSPKKKSSQQRRKQQKPKKRAPRKK